MDENGDLTFEEIIGFGLFRIIDFINNLDFEEVITGSEGP